ncbi:MAG: GNAT family N-acetyltransferase, partial [bacterium]
VVGLAREDGEKMEHRARIWGMYVDPSARKKGVGKSLMKECLEKAGQISGLEQVHLCVVTSNEAAVKLYKSLGFESYGTDPGVLKVDGQLLDEYLMVKMLRNNS